MLLCFSYILWMEVVLQKPILYYWRFKVITMWNSLLENVVMATQISQIYQWLLAVMTLYIQQWFLWILEPEGNIGKGLGLQALLLAVERLVDYCVRENGGLGDYCSDPAGLVLCFSAPFCRTVFYNTCEFILTKNLWRSSPFSHLIDEEHWLNKITTQELTVPQIKSHTCL